MWDFPQVTMVFGSVGWNSTARTTSLVVFKNTTDQLEPIWTSQKPAVYINQFCLLGSSFRLICKKLYETSKNLKKNWRVWFNLNTLVWTTHLYIVKRKYSPWFQLFLTSSASPKQSACDHYSHQSHSGADQSPDRERDRMWDRDRKKQAKRGEGDMNSCLINHRQVWFQWSEDN